MNKKIFFMATLCTISTPILPVPRWVQKLTCCTTCCETPVTSFTNEPSHKPNEHNNQERKESDCFLPITSTTTETRKQKSMNTRSQEQSELIEKIDALLQSDEQARLQGIHLQEVTQSDNH